MNRSAVSESKLTFSVGHLVYFLFSSLLVLSLFRIEHILFKTRKKTRFKTVPKFCLHLQRYTNRPSRISACRCYDTGEARGVSDNHLVKCALRSSAETREGHELGQKPWNFKEFCSMLLEKHKFCGFKMDLKYRDCSACCLVFHPSPRTGNPIRM